MFLKRKLACSFCGKNADRVKKLVAGSRGYICDVCAAEAHRIMSEPTVWPPMAIKSRSQLSRVVARIKRLWSHESFERSPASWLA